MDQKKLIILISILGVGGAGATLIGIKAMSPAPEVKSSKKKPSQAKADALMEAKQQQAAQAMMEEEQQEDLPPEIAAGWKAAAGGHYVNGVYAGGGLDRIKPTSLEPVKPPPITQEETQQNQAASADVAQPQGTPINPTGTGGAGAGLPPMGGGASGGGASNPMGDMMKNMMGSGGFGGGGGGGGGGQGLFNNKQLGGLKGGGASTGGFATPMAGGLKKPTQTGSISISSARMATNIDNRKQGTQSSNTPGASNKTSAAGGSKNYQTGGSMSGGVATSGSQNVNFGDALNMASAGGSMDRGGLGANVRDLKGMTGGPDMAKDLGNAPKGASGAGGGGGGGSIGAGAGGSGPKLKRDDAATSQDTPLASPYVGNFCALTRVGFTSDALDSGSPDYPQSGTGGSGCMIDGSADRGWTLKTFKKKDKGPGIECDAQCISLPEGSKGTYQTSILRRYGWNSSNCAGWEPKNPNERGGGVGAPSGCNHQEPSVYNAPVPRSGGITMAYHKEGTTIWSGVVDYSVDFYFLTGFYHEGRLGGGSCSLMPGTVPSDAIAIERSWTFQQDKWGGGAVWCQVGALQIVAKAVPIKNQHEWSKKNIDASSLPSGLKIDFQKPIEVFAGEVRALNYHTDGDDDKGKNKDGPYTYPIANSGNTEQYNVFCFLGKVFRDASYPESYGNCTVLRQGNAWSHVIERGGRSTIACQPICLKVPK